MGQGLRDALYIFIFIQFGEHAKKQLMPRQTRIDAPGALHHVIGRGTEGSKIFRDDEDRKNFLRRLGKLGEALGRSQYLPFVSQSLIRGEQIARQDNCRLTGKREIVRTSPHLYAPRVKINRTGRAQGAAAYLAP